MPDLALLTRFRLSRRWKRKWRELESLTRPTGPAPEISRRAPHMAARLARPDESIYLAPQVGLDLSVKRVFNNMQVGE